MGRGSGHRTVVGTPTRSPGGNRALHYGSCDRAGAEPGGSQPIEALNAPGLGVTPKPGGRGGGRSGLEAGSRPVRPEVAQVGADSLRVAVDQVRGRRGRVGETGLVPELALAFPRVRIRSPMPGNGGETTSARSEVRPVTCHGLGDSAADVVPADHGSIQSELVNQPDGRYAPARRRDVPGRPGRPSACRTRRSHVGRARQHRQRRDTCGTRSLAIIGAVTRPPMQQTTRRYPGQPART